MFGILCFGMGLTLREGNREYFYRQLDALFPGLKQTYIRTYGSRYEAVSPQNESLMRLFYEKCCQSGIVYDHREIFAFLNAFEEKQMPQQTDFFSSI